MRSLESPQRVAHRSDSKMKCFLKRNKMSISEIRWTKKLLLIAPQVMAVKRRLLDQAKALLFSINTPNRDQAGAEF